jgi:large subunit ribosomal protein L18
MSVLLKGLSARERRKRRIRKKLSGTSDRPRMCVFRSNRNISVQLIDDLNGTTLVSASTVEKDQRGQGKSSTLEGAKKIGSLIAEKAKAKGIESVVFDRNGFRFHGRLKALADAAREQGLKF